MRGCAAILLLSLSFSSPVLAQCNWTSRASHQFRSTVFDVATEDSFIWSATGYGIELSQLANGVPVAVDILALPGQTRLVRTRGSLVYAASGTRLYVLRRNGVDIQVVRFIEAGGTINDIEAGPAHLYLATSNGIAQFDLIDATNPGRTNARLETSNLNVTSLAIADTLLYAADGDSSVERFSIATPALPQRTGALESLPRSLAVHAAREQATAQYRVFVSDGQNTELFVNGTRFASAGIGATSLAVADDTGNIFYVAGNDRALRKISVGSTIAILYEEQLAPTSGTANRIVALHDRADLLFVAAGDIGLSTFRDDGGWAQAIPGVTSTAFGASSAYVSYAANGLAELTRTVGATANERRRWATGVPHTIHDSRTDALLTASGTTMTLWDLAPSTPTAAWTGTFPAAITTSVIAGDVVYALLANGALYSVNVKTDAPPQPVSTGAIKATDILRHEGALALVEILNSGNTVIHHYANGNLTSTPRSFTVDGASTAKAALDATRTAVFTFRGITVVNLATGATTVLPGSADVFVKQLALTSGNGRNDVVALTDRSLLVWNAQGEPFLARELPLPADALSLRADATTAGVVTVDGLLLTTTGSDAFPELVPDGNANRYYTKAVAATDRLYLYAADGIDIFSTKVGDTPQHVTGVRAAGVIDLAASNDFLFTLASNGTVAAYSREGQLVAQASLDQGADSQPLGIATANGAPWVAFSKGCLSGGCTKSTLVLDPRSLAVTATLSGGVLDVVTSGNRAYALFDLPLSVRVLDVTNAQSPSQLASRALDTPAASVAYSTGTVYVLGEKLRAFDEATLTPQPERLTAMPFDASQRIRIDGNCAVITGRSFDPQLYALPQWTAAPGIELPSAARAVASQPGRLFVLTDTSLEVWSTVPATQPTKRRAIR